MDRVAYLNVGCGEKFHAAWTNVDMVSRSPLVQACNLLRGFPYRDGQFEVVYHSQVLEHIPKEHASAFMGECFRVLKPGGIVRVVVPDLENIAAEYLKLLDENLRNPQPQSEPNYDFIMIQMYDQTVRNFSGGQMAQYLRQPELANEAYVVGRIGHVARTIRAHLLATREAERNPVPPAKKKKHGLLSRVKSSLRKLGKPAEVAARAHQSDAERIGAFRLGGEVHMWMYDRFSLARLLRQAGFEHPERKTPFESGIPAWASYELDVKNGAVFDPTSLFMEARKPRA